MNPVKIKSLFKGQEKIPFYQKVNLWSIEDDMAIGLDLQMSAGLELSGHPDLGLKEEVEIENYLVLAKKLIHAVPERTTLQWVIQVRADDPDRLNQFLELAKGGTDKNELSKEVLKAKEIFFKAKFIQRKRHFLFVTTYPKNQDLPKAPLMAVWERPAHKWTKDIHLARQKQLNALVENISDSLTSLNVKSRRLKTQELFSYFYEHLNPNRAKLKLSSDIYDQARSKASTRSLLALSGSAQEFDRFTVDGIHHQAVNLHILPEALQISDMSNFLTELWPDYDLNFTFHSVNSEKLIEKLKTEGNISKALSFSNFGSRYEAEQKFAELDELIREIRSTPQKLFTFSLCALFKSKDLDHLETNTALGVKAFQGLGSAVGIVDNLNHEDLYLSFLPNHSHLNSRRHVIHTNPLAHLLPLTDSWKGTSQPKMLFENPQGEFISMDLFDPSLPSKHALLVGSTGSGKSFATNYLLTHFHMESEDNHIVIIDIGGSYRKLCQLFKGQYFSVDLSDQYAFNPFPSKTEVFSGRDFDEDAIAYLTLIMERMIMDQGESMGSLGETILEKSIKRAYFNLESSDFPTLKDVRESLRQIAGDDEVKKLAAHFYNNLEIWTEGRYGKIFNTRQQLNAKNRLMVFDLEKLTQHPRLQSVYFYVIREIIDSKLKNKRLKKMIVIDEGWRFFDDDVGSRLIESLYRTARKSNGMILSISQSPLDFLNTKAANAIISNSYVKYVLRLTKGHELLPQFGFNKAEIEAIRNLSAVPRKFSDVFLKFNNDATVLRIEPSPMDYWICTTDPEDRVREDLLRKQKPNWTEVQIIKSLASGSGQGGGTLQ